MNKVEEYLKRLPFEGIPSRLVSAQILSYYGYSDQVSGLMLRLNHVTRAHFVHANMLGGFLVPILDYIQTSLEKAQASTELWSKITKYQDVDVQAVLT